MRIERALLVSIAWAAWLVALLSSAVATDSPTEATATPPVSTAAEARLAIDLATLNECGIESSPQGALTFLDSLLPRPEQEAKVASLVAALGDTAFARREAAMQQLLRTAGHSAEALQAAADSPDLEIRWRARQVIAQSEAKSAAAMLAALRVLSARPVEGSCARILAILPLCRRGYITDAGHLALLAAVGPNDLDVLRQALAGDDANVRIGAVIALAKQLAPEGRDELAVTLFDADPRVALAAARVFADVGDRRCLAPLVAQLGADSAEIRVEAAMILRMSTGETLKFAAHDSADKRASTIALWKNWVEENGTTAKLRYPLLLPRLARGDLAGNTLLSTGSSGIVEERDPTGKVVWSYPLAAWSAEKMANGHVLIGSYNNNTVVEVDEEGKIVWQMDGINAMRAKPLPGDRVLIADFNGKRVLEVDRDKRVVWEQPTPGECFDCDRLANGNTVYGCPNVVCEITPEGKVVREWQVGGRLNGFQILDNGNLLIANYGENRVEERTPDNEVIWSFQEPQPCDVFRTVAGETLISTAARIIEVGADEENPKVIRDAQYGSARR